MSENKRPVLATLHRKCEGQRFSKPIWVRRYKYFLNAVPKAVSFSLWSGQPGDVIEFALETGLQIATCKLTTNGPDVQWSPEFKKTIAKEVKVIKEHRKLSAKGKHNRN